MGAEPFGGPRTAARRCGGIVCFYHIIEPGSFPVCCRALRCITKFVTNSLITNFVMHYKVCNDLCNVLHRDNIVTNFVTNFVMLLCVGRRPGRGFSTRSTRCTQRCGAAAARPTWESSPRYALGRPFHWEGPTIYARANRRAPRGSAGGRRSGEGQGQAKSPPRRRMRLGFGPPCMMSGPQTLHDQIVLKTI